MLPTRYKIEHKTETILLRCEQWFGCYFSALLVAFILLFVAAIYVTPSIAPKELGRGYAALSINPFDFNEHNNLRLRILTPLLAHYLGLRGKLYIIFPLIIALFFLTTVYFFLRKRLLPLESLYTTMLICFSSPILFLLHYQGYVDVTSYLIILLIIIYIKKVYVWIPFMALLLLNHESNLFIVPSLLFMHYLSVSDKTKATVYIITGTILALIPFYFFRSYISELSPVEYNFKMYISQIKENIKVVLPYCGVGIFYAFKLFWLFPALAIFLYWKEKNKQQLLLFLLILLGALGQLVVASDTSRLLGLAFLLILFSAFKIKETYGTALFTKWSFYLILVNFLIPQFYVGQSVMIPFYPLPVLLVLKYCFGIET